MKKDSCVYIKVTSQQKKKLKDLGVGFTKCFEVGYEKIMENEKEELEKIVKKRHQEYIRVYTKLKDFEKINSKKVDELEKLREIYIAQGRSVYNPSQQDSYWVEGRVQKLSVKIPGLTVEKFFDYCKEVDK